MIGIDTNILVRYFTQDDLEQAKIVEHIIDTHATSANSIFINNIVMCELIWVLERGYKYSREEIGKLIKQMLSTEEFAFENQELLWLALNGYNQNNLDFADALIGEINKEFDCIETLTFDKGALKANHFKLAQVKF
jgi:predicted nucleic-acid-binding protein